MYTEFMIYALNAVDTEISADGFRFRDGACLLGHIIEEKIIYDIVHLRFY